MPQIWPTPSLSNTPPTDTGRGSSTTYTGPERRCRQSSSVNACSRSRVDPKASGDSSSERSRMSRKSAQSSGVSRRRSAIVFSEDAGRADVQEAHPAVDARGRVVVRAQEDGADPRLAAGTDQSTGDGRAGAGLPVGGG